MVIVLAVGPATAESVNSDVRSVSIQEYEKFGVVYANAVHNKDIQKVARLFDMKSFAYLSARTVYDSKTEVDAYVEGVTRVKKEDFLSQILKESFKRDVDVKFLRLLKGNRPLIRIDFKEGGHEYIILDVKSTTDNNLVVNDMFILTTGRKLSETMGAVTQLMLRPGKSVLMKIFGKSEIDDNTLRSIRELANLRKKGKYKEAYDLIESFPDALKNKRVMIDMTIQLAQSINDEEYRKQLSRLDKYYGNDETTAFILIDHYHYTENYNKAQLSINRLINKYGEDGALLNLKASTSYVEKNYIKSIAYAKKAIKVEPQFESAYWTLATSLTDEEDFRELINVLNVIEKKFGYTFNAENFMGNDFYLKFVKSSEFKARYN